MPIIREELSPKGNILRKLGYFCVGLAMGFMLLGLFQKARKAELAKLRAEQEAAAKQPFVPGLPVPPGANITGAAPASQTVPAQDQSAPKLP
jgi:hypothetical protein